MKRTLALFTLMAAAILMVGQKRVAGDAAHPQSCTSESATCSAFVGYVPAANMNLSRMATLFSVDYTALLGPNDFNLSLPDLPAAVVPAGNPYRVPVTCGCLNGTRVTTSVNYTVVPDDTLSLISNTYYAGLVTYFEIANASGVADPNKIYPKQSFLIPINCACSASSTTSVLSYQIKSGQTVDAIAATYDANASAVLALNANDSDLIADDILFVPLSVCKATFSKGAIDANLSVANGAYELTANNCVQCYCNNGTLNCIPTPSSFSKNCQNLTCKGSNVTLGSFEASKNDTACTVHSCVYKGYATSGILSSLKTSVDATCPAPPPAEPVYNPPNDLTTSPASSPTPSTPSSPSTNNTTTTTTTTPSNASSHLNNKYNFLSLLVIAVCTLLL